MAAELFEGCGGVGWCLDKRRARFVGIFSEAEKVENEKSSCRKIIFQYRICIKIYVHAMHSINAIVSTLILINIIIFFFRNIYNYFTHH